MLYSPGIASAESIDVVYPEELGQKVLTQKIVIVGGGHAGGRLAQLLSRTRGQLGVTLVGSEHVRPYERPPLSKGVLLGTETFDDCAIWKSGDASWTEVSARIGQTVRAIDSARRHVILEDGADIPYDQLVIATGSKPREYSVSGSHLNGVLTLRSYADAVMVSERFRTAKRLLVVGGGSIGLEVAAAATQLGLSSRVVEASDRLLGRLVPNVIATTLAAIHEARGVQFTFGAMVERFVGDRRGNVKAARLTTGETLACDLVLVAVGAQPNTELARDAGLALDVGIATDETLQTSDPSIFACGDVAAFWHPLFEQRTRFESWQNAEDHASILAAVLVGATPETPPVPFFWSEQYEFSLQIQGVPHLGSSTRRRKTTNSNLLLYHYDPLERLVGITAFGPPNAIGREVRRTKRLIAARALYDPNDYEISEPEDVRS